MERQAYSINKISERSLTPKSISRSFRSHSRSNSGSVEIKKKTKRRPSIKRGKEVEKE
jgi:hypothetical protein